VDPLRQKLLDAYLASHHGVISIDDARSPGITDDQVRWCLRTGRWATVHRGVYRRAGEAVGTEALLMAACLGAGPSAVASHASAAWLWRLVTTAPSRPSVTVAPTRSARLSGVDQHRRDDVDPSRILVRRGIPVTDPIRTLADLGAGPEAGDLDDAIDRALSSKLITVDALTQEVARLARPGRRGVPRLRAALERRGLVAAPHPSVLESRTLRLLRRWGIRPIGVEVVACEGRYRLDVLLRPSVALEVDGYAYHWSPESKTADSRRRNELRLAGMLVIEADWLTVMREPRRLRAMVVATLGLAPAASTGSPP
jgi:hypothetical protein